MGLPALSSLILHILCDTSIIYPERSQFLEKFEAGQLGDEADYFDWYSYAQLLNEWQTSRSAIHSAIR